MLQPQSLCSHAQKFVKKLWKKLKKFILTEAMACQFAARLAASTCEDAPTTLTVSKLALRRRGAGIVASHLIETTMRGWSEANQSNKASGVVTVNLTPVCVPNRFRNTGVWPVVHDGSWQEKTSRRWGLWWSSWMENQRFMAVARGEMIHLQLDPLVYSGFVVIAPLNAENAWHFTLQFLHLNLLVYLVLAEGAPVWPRLKQTNKIQKIMRQ
jgi:hypothetical protein